MDINASIIDQHVTGLWTRMRDRLVEELGAKMKQEIQGRSAAFVLLAVKLLLGFSDDEDALACITEGGNDFGVDALHIGDVIDGEFVVSLFQGKYNHENLEGKKGFKQDGVEKAVQAVRALFDPKQDVTLNDRLRPQVEEVRALILDGNIPRVRFFLCSNGAPWSKEAQEIIDREGFGEHVSFMHVNHDRLFQIIQAAKPVDDILRFSGRALVDDLNYARVFVGKMSVAEIAQLMQRHGDRLLERNIRRYLGLRGNRVNEAIAATLKDPRERPNFYFYNNGVTLICEQFSYNALQAEDHKVSVKKLQVINGGQTSKTIEMIARENPHLVLDDAFVLVRLYQISGGDGVDDVAPSVDTITYATNSQNPVELKDLRSNDEVQKRLETSIAQLGYEYRRKRVEGSASPNQISVQTAAEAVLSVWREKPQQAKFRGSEHFGKLYDTIFTDSLSGAQVITAVLLFRIAENKRKRPPSGAPEFVRYASCFEAMLMGRYLLEALGVSLAGLDHRNFEAARTLIESDGEAYFTRSVHTLEGALKNLYGDQPVSAHRLAATFRRGDLLDPSDANSLLGAGRDA